MQTSNSLVSPIRNGVKKTLLAALVAMTTTLLAPLNGLAQTGSSTLSYVKKGWP